MTNLRRIPFLIVPLIVLASVIDAEARPRTRVSPALRTICPRIVDLDPDREFYKNNKPLRASSAINAPVIGYFKQMTLANNAGVSSAIGTRVSTMYDRKGGVLTVMTPYSCRPDHCGGRVVSVGQTHLTRRLAISRTGKPVGFIKIANKTCKKIEDIGRCYGDEVDKTRALCNQVVG